MKWLVLGLAVGIGFPSTASASPDREVRIVVPFAAGGSTDVLARLLGTHLSEAWQRPVVVVDMPGQSSVSGTQAVAAAPPDGHTLLAANAVLAMNEALSRKLPYHALRSFAPVSLLAYQQLVLAVPADSRIASVSELIETGRSSAAQLAYGSPGTGSLGQAAGELLKIMTGARCTHVPQKSGQRALERLAARNLSYAIVPLTRAVPYMRDARIRAIAVTGGNRAAAFPEVPTIGESVPGYEFSTWIALLAPYGASVQKVRHINSAVQAIIRRPDIAEKMVSLGYEPSASTPGEFQSRLRADIERYSRIAFESGMRSVAY